MQIERDAPLRVTSTVIAGNNLTRADTIERRLQQLYTAKTVHDVAQGALQASHSLEQLGVFEHVDLELTAGTMPGECGVRVTVKEKRVMSMKASTFLEQGEGGVEVAIRAAKALGTAESLELSALMGGSEIKGETRRTQLRADYVQPKVWGLPMNLVLSGDSTSYRPLGESTYEDISYGVGVTLKSDFGIDLEWTARQRDILPNRKEGEDGSGLFTYAAPSEIIAGARPSLKSAIALQFSRDWQLPNSQCPRTGSAGKIRAEFASPRLTGGNVDILALSAKLKRTFPLLSDISLTTSIEGGIVRPVTGDYIHLQDRLYLGGPLFLRGFQPRGAGPKSADGKANLGGRNRWQARVGLEAPPPGWSILPSSTRTHMFVSAGSLSDELSIQSLLYKDLRVSVGCGLAFGIALGRLEANIVYAIKAHKGDSLPLRLQFGIGGEFL